MPTLADLQSRSQTNGFSNRESDHAGEELVADSRAYLSPSQQVDQKLRGTLGAGPLLTAGALARRPLKPR